MPTAASTGIDELDDALGGVLPGDNVVWVAERQAHYHLIEQAFMERAVIDHPTMVVATSGAELAATLPAGVERLDATTGSDFAGPGPLADELDRRLAHVPGAHVVIDGFDTMIRRWGPDRALAFFARACPSMLQYGTVTLWRMSPRSGTSLLERVRQITQCFIELQQDQVRVRKAEGRRTPLIGGAFHLRESPTGLRLEAVPHQGRLAQGLSALRRDLGLTKAQLAQLAGVTPSAISQAESNTRGLSLDTLLTLSDRLGVTLDRLVTPSGDPGYRLARFDRHRPVVADGVVALADDPALGLRALFVTLQGYHDAAAPLSHKGHELVAVARGLVQVHVGDDMPVLRAGDSLLATSAGVTHWRNLRPDPAAFYWVLRD
jgi:transcriptional regulator with XRE-family HTH domain